MKLYSQLTIVLVVLAAAGQSDNLSAFERSRSVADFSVHDVHLDADGIGNALYQFATKHELIIGFEPTSPVPGKPVRIDVEEGTVGAVMDAIIAQSPGYRWQASPNGAIHVYNVGGGSSLAAVRVGSFVMKEKNRYEIWQKIEEIPEVRDWMQRTNCSRMDIFGGYEWKGKMDKLWLDGSGKTLEEILDMTALLSGVRSWAVVQGRTERGCFVSIRLW